MSGPERWVCLDVGETLIDETRIWSIWADVLGCPRMTFLAAFGAIVARGQEHHEVFELLGVTDWQSRMPEVRRRYGGFQAIDLYPDALPAISALRDLVYREGIFGGPSCGAVLVAAARVASEMESGTIVALLPDGGWKYLSAGTYSTNLDEMEEALEGGVNWW